MLTGDGKLRIALGSTSGSEFDSLCQPSTTFTADNGRGTVNGVKCTQGVTLHLTYHTSSVPASKCNAAGWDEIMEDCQTVQLTCGGSSERPCLCDEVRRPALSLARTFRRGAFRVCANLKRCFVLCRSARRSLTASTATASGSLTASPPPPSIASGDAQKPAVSFLF